MGRWGFIRSWRSVAAGYPIYSSYVQNNSPSHIVCCNIPIFHSKELLRHKTTSVVSRIEFASVFMKHRAYYTLWIRNRVENLYHRERDIYVEDMASHNQRKIYPMSQHSPFRSFEWRIGQFALLQFLLVPINKIVPVYTRDMKLRPRRILSITIVLAANSNRMLQLERELKEKNIENKSDIFSRRRFSKTNRGKFLSFWIMLTIKNSVLLNGKLKKFF